MELSRNLFYLDKKKKLDFDDKRFFGGRDRYRSTVCECVCVCVYFGEGERGEGEREIEER